MENDDKKESVKTEVLFALRIFDGDLRCYSDALTAVASDGLAVAELNHLRATVERTTRRLEDIFDNPGQLELKFPGW